MGVTSIASRRMGDQSRRKEIYTYEAPWNVFALAWSHRLEPHLTFRLAIGSFIEDYNNKVQIVQRTEGSFVKVAEVDHPYPCTKALWNPEKSGGSRDLLATTGDYLRLWHVSDDKPGVVTMQAQLNNAKNTEYCSPLTSFDWNEMDPNTIGTSSIDTTCTIWDVPTTTPTMQLIAHDKEVRVSMLDRNNVQFLEKELNLSLPALPPPHTSFFFHQVYDISFARNKNIFASVGADGSVRTFDLRNLEHSTIIYETADLSPLLRITWNQQVGPPSIFWKFLM